MNRPHTPSSAFPSTGLPGLDQILQGLRFGDNVVFQVESIEDYLEFVQPYVRQSIRDKGKLIYFRFARHAELLPKDTPGVQRLNISPDAGFEPFVSEVVSAIGHHGLESLYLFDSLSDLAVDWFSDSMLANFFMIVCPYLYTLDTIAYFALRKKRHSSTAIDGIHNTAQLIIDVYRHGDRTYVQPVKSDGRYSPTIFTLHQWRGETFEPVRSSSEISEVLSQIPQPWLEFSSSRPGTWRSYFLEAQQVLTQQKAGEAEPEAIDACFNRLMRMALTREDRFHHLVRKYLSLEDLIRVLGRMVGTGLIGGKALGMLLARAMLWKDCPAAQAVLEPHDSFFVGSDVFYTHLVRNNCWWLRHGTTLEERLDNAKTARERVIDGQFTETVTQQFEELLDYFGQSPLIVRSSSLLEDNYGNAFSGKYESFFCANQGTPSQRLEAFVDAVRQVYASSLSEDALIYRSKRGLLEQDEQMALLIQRVSGNRFGPYMAPHAAGVGFSFNAYAWHKDIDRSAGMLRLVVGLGTRAVNRTDDDYATLVALNAPHIRPQTVQEDPKHFSQRKIDVIDLSANRFQSVDFRKLVEHPEGFPIADVAEQDPGTLARLRYGGIQDLSAAWIPNLAPLLKRKEFVHVMREALRALELAYGNAVDVEFTVNLNEDGGFSVNLVQCRPFQVKIKKAEDIISLGDLPADTETLFATRGPIIGPRASIEIDRIIYVVPSEYSRLSTQDRYEVARLIGRITHLTDKGGNDQDTSIMVIGPGRWGTSTPALGIPVNFSEIENISAIVEVGIMHQDLVPDVSIGTHFFNDLVELDILYLTVLPNREGHALNQPFFENASENVLTAILPQAARFAPVLRVIDCGRDGQPIRLFADTRKQRACCFCTGCSGGT
jgi:pyruvate,water dikinase